MLLECSHGTWYDGVYVNRKSLVCSMGSYVLNGTLLVCSTGSYTQDKNTFVAKTKSEFANQLVLHKLTDTIWSTGWLTNSEFVLAANVLLSHVLCAQWDIIGVLNGKVFWVLHGKLMVCIL